MTKPTILFLCTGNSCRSQMAEGWAKATQADSFEIFSAGVEAHGLNPNAVAVMQEVGIDISQHQSQTLAELPIDRFDYVFAVCDHAQKNCPYTLGRHMILHTFDDPPRLARNAETEEETLACFRQVRDEIKHWVENLPAEISAQYS